MSIVTVLEKRAGFFSNFFFLLNHYIFCKKHNIRYKIKSDNWTYKYKDGWIDYFDGENLNYTEFNHTDRFFSHSDVLENYSIMEYKQHIFDIYKYNESTTKQINDVYKELNLEKHQYDSIYIRRGDKMASESVYIPEEKYITLLLKKNPSCKIIYLQTDDYTCYENLKEYIQRNQLDIQLITLCDKHEVGVIFCKGELESLNNAVLQNRINKHYISTLIDKMNKSKPFQDMNPDEIYKHTIDFFKGIDIVMNSNICVTDYQSNVSRFIKLAHTNSDHVYDATRDNDINDDNKVCPSYTWSF